MAVLHCVSYIAATNATNVYSENPSKSYFMHSSTVFLPDAYAAALPSLFFSHTFLSTQQSGFLLGGGVCILGVMSKYKTSGHKIILLRPNNSFDILSTVGSRAMVVWDPSQMMDFFRLSIACLLISDLHSAIGF